MTDVAEKDSIDNSKLSSELLELKKFEQWRNNNILAYNGYFKALKSSVGFNSSKENGLLIFFRQCIVQLTRQMCKCSEKCTNNSFKNILFLGDPIQVDKKNEIFDNYNDCSIFGIHISDGIMYDEKDNLTDKNFKLRLRKLIFKLCHGESSSFQNLICLSFEIKDICKNDSICIKNYSISKLPRACINKNVKPHLLIFKDLFKRPILNIIEEINEKIVEKENENSTVIEPELEELLISTESTLLFNESNLTKFNFNNLNFSKILNTTIPIDFSRGEMLVNDYGINPNSKVPNFILKKSEKELPFDLSRADKYTDSMIEKNNLIFDYDLKVCIFLFLFVIIFLSYCGYLCSRKSCKKNEQNHI